MLRTLKGNGFDCLFTLVPIKMEHPRPLQVCTNVCIIFAHTGAGGIRVLTQTKVILYHKSFMNLLLDLLQYLRFFAISVYVKKLVVLFFLLENYVL